MLSIHPSKHPPIHPFIHPSVHPSIHPSGPSIHSFIFPTAWNLEFPKRVLVEYNFIFYGKRYISTNPLMDLIFLKPCVSDFYKGYRYNGCFQRHCDQGRAPPSTCVNWEDTAGSRSWGVSAVVQTDPVPGYRFSASEKRGPQWPVKGLSEPGALAHGL